MNTAPTRALEAGKAYRLWPWFVGAIAAVIVGTLTGIGIAVSGEKTQGEAINSIPQISVPVIDETKTSTPAAPPPISDFTLDLKTVSKHCFGSAGCNLVLEPKLSYAGSTEQLDAFGTCNVTYKITGGESGEVIETAYGQGGTQFEANRTILETTSNAVTPSATVSDVSCS